MVIEQNNIKKSNLNKKEKNKLEQRLNCIYSLTKRIFENNQAGILDNDTSSKMLKEYQLEQTEIKEKIKRIDDEFESNENEEINYHKLKEEINKFTSFDELSPTIINSLIERIEIGYRNGNTRNIKIHYKFIDDFIY